MPEIVIHDVPADLHRRLEEEAARHRRPVEAEALAILRRMLDAPPAPEPPNPIRGRMKITQVWLDSAIGEGRA